MSTMKKIGLGLAITLLIACIGVNGWYFYIKELGPSKVVASTFEVGLQETVDGDSKYFIEVNSYDDCFEIKFNYMLDENKTDFYSQGIQFYGDEIKFGTSSKDFEEKYIHDGDGTLWWDDNWYNKFTKYVLTSGSNYYYMMESDDDVGMISSNPLSSDTFFKIDLNGSLYGMKLKGDNTPMIHEENYAGYTYRNETRYKKHHINLYYYYDIEYMLQYIVSSVNSLPYGTNDVRIFEFADIFDYYEYTGEGVYEETPASLDKAKLIEAEVKSYYGIKVTKHEGNIKKASDSLFNSVAGNAGFNISGVESENYFYGKTIITADNSAFTYVKLTDNHVALKLKKEFVNSYLPYSEKIELNVLVDLDDIISQGYEFVGFTADNGLSNFTILDCQTVQTINGELVYAEVDYVT